MLIADSTLLNCACYTPNNSPTVFLGRAARSCSVMASSDMATRSDRAIRAAPSFSAGELELSLAVQAAFAIE